MQAVKGYLSNGWFTPTTNVVLPSHTEVLLVFVDSDVPTLESTESHFSESEIKARVEGLKRLEAALALTADEDLSNFPKQGLMKTTYDDWAD